MNDPLQNFVNGRWQVSNASDYLVVTNPATGQTIAQAPITPAAEVDFAVQAGTEAFKEWRRTPVTDRIQPLFQFKSLLEANLEDLARTVTLECGKTFS
jgi:malonate-semialdehyde dehydrogenase (acetylating)/methylmalonate-semialdehyde dehydrogenase